MPRYQVWIGGWNRFDTVARDEREARADARDWLGVKRLPDETSVCIIPDDYYDGMRKHNEEQLRDVLNANSHLCSTDF